MKTTRTILIVAMLAGVVVSGYALTTPPSAVADTIVTGWQTGYSYHQGLANGDGGALMASQDDAAATAVSQTTNTPAPSNTSASDVSVVPASSQTTEVQPAADQAVTNPSAAVPAATTQTASPGFLASLTLASWFGLGLIALAIILGIIALASSSDEPRRTITTTRSYERYT